MALRITTAADPIKVERLTVVLYGAPGSGKTSLAFTADAPLLLDFDRGAHRAANRKDTVQVREWADVANITADDLAPFRTVIVDTAGRALDSLTADIIGRNPKMGRAGVLTLQGYGQLKGDFIGWLRNLNAAGKDVVLIAHSDEQRSGDEVNERLDVQGGSKNEIYKSADAMGRLQVTAKGRVLNFNPTDTSFGKNPAGLEPLEVPPPANDPQFLANVIASIKAKLNEESAEAQAEQKRLEDWRAVFAEIESVDDFNAKVAELADERPKVKGLLVAAAEAKGITFDKRTKKFSMPQQQAA